MADPSERDSFTDDIDEDELLAGLSAEELKELQSEMDVIAPDERVPVGQRQKNSAVQRTVKEDSDQESECGDDDEDEILAGLSAEELKQLQSEMDVIAPDERVPVGQRQRDQTEKAPTGTFDRRSLVDYMYWEKESKRMLDEERVPVTLLPSEKKMREAAEQKEKEQVVEVVEEVVEEEVPDGVDEVEYVYEEVVEEVEAEDGQVGEEVIEEVIEEIIEEVVEVKDKTQEETQEENKQAEGAEKQDNKQAECAETQDKKEAAITGPKDSPPLEAGEGAEPQGRFEDWVPEKEERVISKLKIPKLALGGNALKLTARPSGNETNLDSTLHKIRNNNPAVTEVNLNNIENIPKDMLLDYVSALKKNKHVKTFSLANTGADETTAFCLANMLRENKSVATLNIESNFITGKGIIAIVRCLQFNETLTELRFHNQRHMLGHHAEMEVSRLLKANHTLLKMGYHFELPGPRMVVTNLLTRNLDRQRQLRHEEQKLKDVKQQRELLDMYEASLNLPPGLLDMLSGYLPPDELLAQLQHHHQLLQQQQTHQEAPEPSRASPEPGPALAQLRKTQNLHSAAPKPAGSDPGSLIKDVQLKKTPKKRDPCLDAAEERRPRASVQLRKTARPTDVWGTRESALMADERANLKDMLKTLKPVPRRRVPPKVEMTPRDELLSEIRQSNVAYLKAVPLPKELESSETSLF
ncbi:leiomodin-3 [Alosa sapidissima]|uniref:leiomodin-3 n=1 Tax=Alosa sapidissima TaxID=34773 RepID=UPI001C0838D2|nr:leiomodin-3 [Alosa sapidissima]